MKVTETMKDMYILVAVLLCFFAVCMLLEISVLETRIKTLNAAVEEIEMRTDNLERGVFKQKSLLPRTMKRDGR